MRQIVSDDGRAVLLQCGTNAVASYRIGMDVPELPSGLQQRARPTHGRQLAVDRQAG